MDYTQRKMTKIAREVSKFTVQTMKEEGIGTAEFDYIHFVRHHPGHLARELILLHAERSVRIAGDSFDFRDDTYRVEEDS